MKLKNKFRNLALLGTLLVSAASAQNIADPQRHPYADPDLGRDGYELAGEEVNSTRLYDFYARQADYSMRTGTPRFLPAYPGLDAGRHGHWGKYNQNNHEDDRWNQQQSGGMIGAALHVGKTVIHKAVNLQLGDQQQLSACFDPWTLTYRRVWSDGFVKYHPFRWGTSRGLEQVGETQFTHHGVWLDNDPRKRIDGATFQGVYRYGRQVAFGYQVGMLEVLDAPWAVSRDGTTIWMRRLQLSSRQAGEHRLPICAIPANAKRTHAEIADGMPITEVFQRGDECWVISLVSDHHELSLVQTPGAKSLDLAVDIEGDVDDLIEVRAWHGQQDELAAARRVIALPFRQSPSMTAFRTGGPSQWPQTVTVTGLRSQDTDPYVIDTIPLPFKNPFQSVMMLSGIDFLPSGVAVVCTLSGDVWTVSGLDDRLGSVTWKRFAAGLNQPFGIKYDDGQLFVLAKDRLHILSDLNQDGEADFYQNYDNSWVETHGHTHVFGLDRDRAGNFYFPSYDLFYKLPPDGSGVQLIAKGFRNCMGVAVNDDGLVLAAPQEGTWTPASMIIEVREGEHYGHRRKTEPIDGPMCFIPRGIDNSTGGMVFVDSERWGPLGKSLIGLSYGYGSHYLILRDESVPRAHGAVVPLKGEFLSGVNRGRINPEDGQLYVVGTDGWGNYRWQTAACNASDIRGSRFTNRSDFASLKTAYASISPSRLIRRPHQT